MQIRTQMVIAAGRILKEKMRSKLDEQHRWTYVRVPEGVDRAEFIKRQQAFIDTGIPAFIDLCLAVLPSFNLHDSETIGAENPTENARKFMGLFAYLEANGFPGPSIYRKPVNFWSGEAARSRAVSLETELSDNQAPAIAVMFDLCEAIQDIQGEYNTWLRLLSASISRIFAMHAFGVANVYISSDKPCEDAGLTVGNNFWEAELGILQRRLAKQQISDIRIHVFDHLRQVWNPPVSLNSPEGMGLQIRRRSFHRHDDEAHLDRFKAGKSEAERELWRQSGQRPTITLGSLKRIAGRWRVYSGSRLFAPVVAATFAGESPETDRVTHDNKRYCTYL